MLNNILWLDTETTGLDPNKNFLIQLSYINTLDNQIRYDNDLYMRPQYIEKFEIEQSALDKNKITVEQIKNFELEEKQIKVFLNDLTTSGNKYYLAGYNVKFDIEFLKALFARHNYTITNYFNYLYLDVLQLVINLKLAGKINPENCKLGTILQYFNLIKDIDSLHNAKQDILCTKILYDFLISKFNI